ncbi:hypothetical protein [Zhongshania sp.]|uniref:hypothetical protein n=1 Tax=Zhongshania sp. TaxID=1971902 RepID=UPI003563CF15
MARGRLYKFEKWTLHSKYEVGIAEDLREKGIEFDYEAKTFKYTVQVPHTHCTECGAKPASKTAKYTPDFFLPNGIIVEAKGRWTSSDRKKMAAMAEQYPELDIRMLFKSDNWLTKAHRDSYSTWCEKRGIPYHVGDVIPEEWLNG